MKRLILIEFLIFNFYSLLCIEPIKISVLKCKKFKEENYTPYMLNLITEDTEEKKNNVDIYVVIDAIEDNVFPNEIIEFILNNLSSNDRIAIFSNSYEYNLEYSTEENKKMILDDIIQNFPNFNITRKDENDSNLIKAANLLKLNYNESSSRIPVIITYNYGYSSIDNFKNEYTNTNIPFTIYSISTSNSQYPNRGRDLSLVKFRDGYLYRIRTEDLKIGVLPFIIGNIQTIFAKKAQVTIKSNYSLKLLGKDIMYSVESSENEKEIKINLLQIPYGRKISFAIGVIGNLQNNSEVLEINLNYKTIDNKENNLTKKKLYLTNDYIKEETYVDYIYFYSLNEALNAFDLYNKGENENALSKFNSLYSDIQTKFPEKNLLASITKLKNSTYITSLDGAYLLFLSRRPGMAFNIYYDDSNTFTKKIKNSLYKFTLPENANLLTVPGKQNRTINIELIGIRGSFLYLYITSAKNGYIKYNEGDNIFIDSNDTLAIMNSEYESTLLISNEDENFPINLYYWIKEENTQQMIINIPRNIKVLLGLYYSSFKVIFYTLSYELNDETFTFRIMEKKSTQTLRPLAKIFPKYYFSSTNAIFQKMEYIEGTDPIYYFSESLLMGYTNFSQINPTHSFYSDYKYSLTEPLYLNNNFTAVCVYTDATDEYSPTPDNVYIYQVFEKNQRHPHLHLLRKKDSSHKLIRIELSINTQLLEIAINKYKKYIPNEDYFYTTNKDFQIKSFYQFGRRILYIYLPDNTNEIILSVFSNENFHIPTKNKNYWGYVFKYNSGVDENDFKEYFIKNKNNLNETNMLKKQTGDFLKVTLPTFQLKKGETITNHEIKMNIFLHYANFLDNYYIHNHICINYLNLNVVDNLKKKLTMNDMYEYNSVLFNFKDIMVNIIGITFDNNTLLFLEKDIIYYDNNTMEKITNDNISNTDLGNSINLYNFTINIFNLNQTSINEKITNESDYEIETSEENDNNNPNNINDDDGGINNSNENNNQTNNNQTNSSPENEQNSNEEFIKYNIINIILLITILI